MFWSRNLHNFIEKQNSVCKMTILSKTSWQILLCMVTAWSLRTVTFWQTSTVILISAMWLKIQIYLAAYSYGSQQCSDLAICTNVNNSDTKLNCIMTNIMHTFLIYLSIYFWLTYFRLSFSPTSEAGVQLRQWFKSIGYDVSARAPTPYPKN
jgi:hypothetical protein